MGQTDIDKEKLIKFLQRSFNVLPRPYTNGLSTHSSLVYFIVSGLDLLGRLDLLDSQKEHIISWAYSLQILPSQNNQSDEVNIKNCGFRGAHYIGLPFLDCRTIQSDQSLPPPLECDIPNLANTYCSLLILRILGDDFSGINKKAIIKSLKYHQRPDGSFSGSADNMENDMRYLFCACAISFMLNDWSGMDTDLAYQYIVSSQTYEYAFAQGPNQEAHGGYTYCALSALALMNKLKDTPHQDQLLYWLVNRQFTGFNGRCNKDVDTCYSFWVGASLDILSKYHNVIDENLVKGFTIASQHESIGGIAKEPQQVPDLMHNYLSISGLSILGHPSVLPLNSVLGISQRAAGADWNNKLINQLSK
ncbi:hypothetical protein DLAC_07041 [Tieghemostelium lacteum]|uniref:Prenyltransferase alpha-alpha toroid domain-containing protein n=1 Tax=Tieghemostelium lacteum TaxID=361077 RepID=A0A151ZE80_TIELA|nr:hypothetical protein DLAC_07041 [Tieghemostelium lacteum]|eukprot:KYQ92194.1 hypothetical protein DLAC_07041 [Tieghemostelium lacteum]